MALAHELVKSETTGALSDESRGTPWGETIRDYEPSPDTIWRFGKPNYARVNDMYFKHRAKKHKEGSLESVVSKIVKNWEVESHHIADVNQWKTMEVPSFTIAVNGGLQASAQLMSDEGPYNLLMGEMRDYSSKLNTFESSNTLWSRTFPDGFAWEVLEVLAGPPAVTFKWRHFSSFTGTFIDRDGRSHKGNGEMINLIGLCIAKVNEGLQVQSLDVYYNPEDLVGLLLKNSTCPEGERPVDGEPAAARCTNAESCAVM